MHARLMWLNTIALGLLPVTVAESSTAPQLALPPEISAIVLKERFPLQIHKVSSSERLPLKTTVFV